MAITEINTLLRFVRNWKNTSIIIVYLVFKIIPWLVAQFSKVNRIDLIDYIMLIIIGKNTFNINGEAEKYCY